MKKWIFELETALKYFAVVCAEQDVPVGITVTTSGRFVVKHSLSPEMVLFDKIEDAIVYVIVKYNVVKSKENG